MKSRPWEADPAASSVRRSGNSLSELGHVSDDDGSPMWANASLPPDDYRQDIGQGFRQQQRAPAGRP